MHCLEDCRQHRVMRLPLLRRQTSVSTLQEYLGNGPIGDTIEQYNKTDNTYWLNANDFF